MRVLCILAILFLVACSTQPNSASSSSSSSLSSAQSSAAASSSVHAFGSFGKSLVSGLPYPPVSNVAQPSGAPGSMVILNWAGYKAAVTYTFDDGQPSQIDNYSNLQAEGVPLTFYLCAGWSNSSANFLSIWSQAVMNGHEIGNHTYHHSHAGDLPTTGTGGTAFGTIIEEIDSNTQWLMNNIGASNIQTFAAPYGDSEWVDDASTRYFVNRGVGGGTIAPNDNTDPPERASHFDKCRRRSRQRS